MAFQSERFSRLVVNFLVLGLFVFESCFSTLDALVKLLKEAPDVSGILIPGIPLHAPGMGGRIGDQLEIVTVESGDEPSRIFREVTW